MSRDGFLSPDQQARYEAIPMGRWLETEWYGEPGEIWLFHPLLCSVDEPKERVFGRRRRVQEEEAS